MRKVRIVRSARQHRIGIAHIRAAMLDAGVPTEVPGTDQLLYVGRDDRGVLLEIIAVPDDQNPEGLAVIHCMPYDYGRSER